MFRGLRTRKDCQIKSPDRCLLSFTGKKLKIVSCMERSSGHVTSNEKCLGQPIPVDEECVENPCKPGRCF